jgi:predicted amidophosphoribosyltransferase
MAEREGTKAVSNSHGCCSTCQHSFTRTDDLGARRWNICRDCPYRIVGDTKHPKNAVSDNVVIAPASYSLDSEDA